MPALSPIVSVVIPAFNAHDTIGETVQSVSNQTYRALDIIVIDDGSTDLTAEIALSKAEGDPRIRIIRQANRGLAGARNTGIAEAIGTLIAPIDADDLWHPSKIAKQVVLMESAPKRVGLVACWGRAIDQNNRVLFDLAKFEGCGPMLAKFIFRNFSISGSPLIKRDSIEAVGGYDETLPARGATCCEDLKLNLSIAARFDLAVVPEFLTSYRMRAGSMSSEILAMQRSHAVVIAEARAEHPELPAELFAWASALSSWEQARAFARRRSWVKAMRCLSEALIEDPSSSMLEAIELLKRSVRRHKGPVEDGPNFLDLSTQVETRSFSTSGFLRAKRLQAIAEMDKFNVERRTA